MKARSNQYLVLLVWCTLHFSLSLTGHASDTFGNGTVITPTTASGGTGSVASLQADDDTEYVVAKSATMTVGGFGNHTGPINSVYLFVQFSVDSGYGGTNALRVNGTSTTIVPADRDYGRWAYIEITGGSFGIDTAAEIQSMTVTFPNNDGGSGDSVFFDCVYVVVNPQTTIPLHPTWIEDFNGTGQANPLVWNYEVGYKRNNELQYYVPGATNGWREDGNFIIEGRKDTADEYPGYAYTSASIVTTNKYYWRFGRAQIRANIPAKAGMWPAIWGTGETGQWPHNGEVDIMEYYQNKILANCAVGTTQQWTAKWDGSNRTMASLTAVDTNWKTQWHIWTMQWDDQNVRLYCDNILMNTIPQSWLKNTDGYNTSWGPQYPFQSNGMTCWLNLAMGGAGGDPTQTMNSGPQRYLIDYWKIWEGATGNVAPTDIVLDSGTVAEGLPAGTVVGNLTALDADPAEVHRYTLVTGTGSNHNGQFAIPEFVSDNTLAGVLKTATVLNAADGPTRSIRVRVTDIEGATYDKVMTVNVLSSGYHVTYDGNGSTGGSVPVDGGGYAEGGTVTVLGNPNNLSLSGHFLSGWNTAADGSGTSYVPGASFTMGASDVTLYAMWATNTLPVADAGVDQTVYMGESNPWTPASITTVAWYDAADAATISQSALAVSQWNDKSGQGNHAVQASAASKPLTETLTIGGLNSIAFDGTDDRLSLSSTLTAVTADGTVKREIFAVVDLDETANETIFGHASSSNEQVTVVSDKLRFWSGTNPYSADSKSTGAVGTDPVLLGFIGDSTKKFAINGTLMTTTDTLDGGVNTIFLNSIGYQRYGAYFSGAMGELLITDDILAPEVRQKLEGYLAHKWGLAASLPAGHPYKDAAPGAPAAIASLNGSVSDVDAQPLNTTWSAVSGPGGVDFENAAAVDTTATFTAAGTYMLRLTVSDGVGGTYDEVVITVTDATGPGPVASFEISAVASPQTVGHADHRHHDHRQGRLL